MSWRVPFTLPLLSKRPNAKTFHLASTDSQNENLQKQRNEKTDKLQEATLIAFWFLLFFHEKHIHKKQPKSNQIPTESFLSQIGFD